MYRFLPALSVVLGLVFMAALAANATEQQPKSHDGTVVKAIDGKLTMNLKGDKKDHTHIVSKTAKITVDGKAAKLEDLKEGMPVTVTLDDGTNTAIVIAARTKKDKE